jgi:hypothetical protein
MCPLCSSCEDTLQHRLLRCSHTSDLRQRLLSPATVQILDDPSQAKPLLLGCQLAPQFEVHRPPGYGHLDFQFWCNDPSLNIAQAFEGEVFTDGSASILGPAEFHSVAWAIVKVDPDTGEILASLSGPVGRALPATSQAAEHVAVLALCYHCPLATATYVDFQGLVGIEFRDDFPRDQLYSGVKLLARGGPAWNPSRQFLKVAAHQDVDALQSGSREWFLAVGNAAADRVAHIARMRMPQPSASDLCLEAVSGIRFGSLVALADSQ